MYNYNSLANKTCATEVDNYDIISIRQQNISEKRSKRIFKKHDFFCCKRAIFVFLIADERNR